MTTSLNLLKNEIADGFAKYAMKDTVHKWINVQRQAFSTSVDDFVQLVNFKVDSKLSTITVAPKSGKVTRIR